MSLSIQTCSSAALALWLRIAEVLDLEVGDRYEHTDSTIELGRVDIVGWGVRGASS